MLLTLPLILLQNRKIEHTRHRVSRSLASATVVGLLLYGQQVSALECAAPPVVNANHAVCLARQFAERPTPPPWELEFQVKERGSHWFVYYGPKLGSGVRGGGGDLKIDKKSGQVTFIRGHR